jgi:hypothetical protein
MGDTLATLIEEVQYELGQAATPAVGQQYREHIKSRINREYRRLYHDFDWPHLRERVISATQAGDRYYDYPAGVTLERTIEVWRRWGARWAKLDRGIELCDFNIFDSEGGGRSDPIMKWAPYGAQQIEVWPIPETGFTQGLAWVVKRAYTPLVDESDVCDLDTDLLVLHTAAELARRFSNDDAQILLGRATQHYATLKSRSQRGGIRVDFTQGPPSAPERQKYAVLGAVGASSVSTTDTVSLSVFVAGMPAAAELLMLKEAERTFTATDDLSSAVADTPATAETVFTITLAGGPFATITFLAGATEGVFAFSSTAVPAGGVLRFIAPASPDATLADINLTLGGTAT